MLATVTNAPSVEPPKHSLVDVANVIRDNSERWMNGVTFTPLYCDPGAVTMVDCPAPVPADDIECTAPVEFAAFQVEMAYNWTTMDLGADPEGVAREAMELATTRLVERAVWTGEVLDPADNSQTATVNDIHALSGATSVGPGGTALDSLGLVLDGLANSTMMLGGLGVIHMNSSIAVALANANQFSTDGTALFTIVGGHRVVIGDYPDDAIVGHLGNVDLYLGDIHVAEFYSRADNEYHIRLDRAVLAAYNNCTAVISTVGGS